MNRTPLTTSFMIAFLILGIPSIRINHIKGNFTQTEKQQYLKKLKTIKKIMLGGVVLFLLCIAIGLILQFGFNYKLSIGGATSTFAIIGIGILVLSTLIHYYIIIKTTKKR